MPAKDLEAWPKLWEQFGTSIHGGCMFLPPVRRAQILVSSISKLRYTADRRMECRRFGSPKWPMGNM